MEASCVGPMRIAPGSCRGDFGRAPINIMSSHQNFDQRFWNNKEMPPWTMGLGWISKGNHASRLFSVPWSAQKREAIVAGVSGAWCKLQAPRGARTAFSPLDHRTKHISDATASL